jgi:hypothetical protein
VLIYRIFELAEFPTVPDYSQHFFGQALVRFIDTEAFVHSALVDP